MTVRLRRFEIDILERDTLAMTEAVSSGGDALKETAVVFESVVKPVILRSEPNEDTGGLAMAGDQDFMRLRLPQIAGQVVFDLG